MERNIKLDERPNWRGIFFNQPVYGEDEKGNKIEATFFSITFYPQMNSFLKAKICHVMVEAAGKLFEEEGLISEDEIHSLRG